MTSATREQRRLLYERLIGNKIADKYTVTGLLGFGGMGAVYEAIQSPMERKVALKLIPTYNPTAAARFEREAYTVSKLNHPNTVTVFDFGHTRDGHLYLAMEHLQGRTLTDLINTEGPLTPERVVHISEQICRSLGEAHKSGIIHRDIKPDNIFLISVDGNPDYVKVLDFGIAKAIHGEEDVNLTAEGRIVGTPRYMSPEQILAQPIDHRSDLYSLGCIMFQMLTGSPPFEDQSTAALMMSHAQKAPPSFAERLTSEHLLGMPAGLEAVVRRTMAKNPASRPQTTDALRKELEEALRINQAYSPAMLQAADRPTPQQTGQQPVGVFEHNTGDFTRQTGDYNNQAWAAGPGTMTQADILAAQGNNKPTWLIVAVAVLLTIVVLGGIYIATQQSQGPGPQPTTDKPTPITSFTLDSVPQGATVKRGDEVLGTTPLTLQFADLTGNTVYAFELDQYKSSKLVVNPTEGERKRSYIEPLDELPPAQKAEDVKPDDAPEDKADKPKKNPRKGTKANRNRGGKNRKADTQPPKDPPKDNATEPDPFKEKDTTTPDPEKDGGGENKPTTPNIQRLDDDPLDKPNVDLLDD